MSRPACLAASALLLLSGLAPKAHGEAVHGLFRNHTGETLMMRLDPVEGPFDPRLTIHDPRQSYRLAGGAVTLPLLPGETMAISLEGRAFGIYERPWAGVNLSVTQDGEGGGTSLRGKIYFRFEGPRPGRPGWQSHLGGLVWMADPEPATSSSGGCAFTYCREGAHAELTLHESVPGGGSGLRVHDEGEGWLVVAKAPREPTARSWLEPVPARGGLPSAIRTGH